MKSKEVKITATVYMHVPLFKPLVSVKSEMTRELAIASGKIGIDPVITIEVRECDGD